MDFVTMLLVLPFVFLTGFYVLRSKNSKLPPGPYPFPIIGNLLQLGRNPHISLAKLSKTYGPLMYLKLGSLKTIVVSSPDMAKEVLQKHDQAFTGRFIPVAAEALDHHKLCIAYLPVGNEWRKYRKICREQMFSTSRLDASQGLRQEKLEKLCEYVRKCAVSGRVVNIGEAAYTTTLNLMSATLFSTEFAQFDSDAVQEMKLVIGGYLRVIAIPNLADFFPALKMIDPQGIKKESEIYTAKMLSMLDDIINQRVKSRDDDHSSRNDDLLEVLLNPTQGNDDYDLTREDIKHFLTDLLIGGTDTSADLVEWGMTELLRNPNKMSKAKDELRVVIGENNRIKESDISRLPYLQAVMKENLRLHPVVPLLVPKKTEVDVEINGYMIPKNAQLVINAWAIGKDPSIWSNSDSFEPERFLNNKIDYKGQDFELIPFGSGRRICPGLPLASRMSHLMLASLIHNFNWKLEPGVKPEELDTNEKFGLTLHKVVPLKAVPIIL
ncbi:hypothetical protein BUALT_Bualt02G0159200 [Buddleja alternifolia]|uniref:Cytochrome P450 n=1 Tax=Buddleja alternifolia TaxID=168488 RepID=A0AAV6Y1U8_9LAMI|nr:hypothetical protein BUALT_Bualt02G0159200 [Buddleja alternifolia]